MIRSHRPMRRRVLARSTAAGGLLERFLVAAVAAVLLIRFYLNLAGYPQVGGRGLHIAHLLWGGLGMLIALVLLLAIIGRRVQYLAALIGGAGFGLFVDELGKFITSDNNYFFRPAIALIYVIFVVLVLLSRAIEHHPRLTREEALANVLDLIRDGVLHELSAAQKRQARRLLAEAGPNDALARAASDMLDRVAAPPASPSRLRQAAALLAARWQEIVVTPAFQRMLPVAFVAYVICVVAGVAVVFVVGGASGPRHPAVGLADRWLLESAAATVILVVIGLVRLPHSRIAGYRWFRRGVLVAIFVMQPFVFYKTQLAAVAGLAFNLLLLGALDILLGTEEGAAPRHEQSHAGAAARDDQLGARRR